MIQTLIHIYLNIILISRFEGGKNMNKKMMKIMNSDGVGAVVLSLMVAVICIVVSVGGTYLFLKGEYEDQQSRCEKDVKDVTEYQNKYESLNEEVEENEISRLKYEKLMFKGIRKNVDGDYSYGYAECDFENAGANYNAGYLDVAITYFDSADVVYAMANNYYKEAESYFNRAIEFAPNDDMEELASLMKDESMYGAQVTSALHQNCEYMSSASDSYYIEDYATGDEQLDIANTFIDTHDSLIPPFENATTDINSLLDLL